MKSKPAIECLCELVLPGNLLGSMYCPQSALLYESQSIGFTRQYENTLNQLSNVSNITGNKYIVDPITNREFHSISAQANQNKTGEIGSRLIGMPVETVTRIYERSNQEIEIEILEHLLSGVTQSVKQDQLSVTIQRYNINEFGNETSSSSNLLVSSLSATVPPGGGGSGGTLKQYVPLNSDNDNNSPLVKFGSTNVTQYVPVNDQYDFNRSMYQNENDLVSLKLVIESVMPENWATRGAYEYKLSVTPNNPAADMSKIKVWTEVTQNSVTYQKGIQLPLNEWTEVGMHDIPDPMLKTLPNFLIEGVKPGEMRSEYTFKLTALWDVNTVPQEVEYKPVEITVTPVIDVNPLVIQPFIHEVRVNTNEGLQDHKILEAAFILDVTGITGYDKQAPVPATSFDIDFTQHILNIKGHLEGGYSFDNIGNQKFKHAIHNDLTLNDKFPFLDTDAPFSIPITPKVKTTDLIDPYSSTTRFEDHPGVLIGTRPAFPQGGIFTYRFDDIDYSFELRTEVNWTSGVSNGNGTRQVDIVYPLGWIEWKVRFKVQNANQVVLPPSSTTIEIEYHQEHVPTYP